MPKEIDDMSSKRKLFKSAVMGVGAGVGVVVVPKAVSLVLVLAALGACSEKFVDNKEYGAVPVN